MNDQEKNLLRTKIHEILKGTDVADCLEILVAILTDFYENYCLGQERDKIKLRMFMFDGIFIVLQAMMSGMTFDDYVDLMKELEEEENRLEKSVFSVKRG